MSVVISFLLSFPFPFLSPLLNHSIDIAARLLSILSLPFFFCLFISPFPSGLPSSSTPAPCCASNLESDRNQFPDFLQPLTASASMTLLYVV